MIAIKSDKFQSGKFLFIPLVFCCLFFCEFSRSYGQEPSAHLPGKVIFPARQYSGSLYFIEEWTRGEVVLNNGRTANDVLLRYDGFSDLLIWLLPGEGNKQVSVDKNLVSSFVLLQADTSYYFSRIDVSGLSGFPDNNAFLQVLQQGPLSLYAYRGVRLTTRLGPVEDQQGRIRQALTLTKEPRYYLKLPDGSLRRVRLNRRSLMLAIDKNLQKTLGHIPASRLRVRSETDLAKAVFFLNGLLEK